jgi:hypothetical protein
MKFAEKPELPKIEIDRNFLARWRKQKTRPGIPGWEFSPASSGAMRNCMGTAGRFRRNVLNMSKNERRRWMQIRGY